MNNKHLHFIKCLLAAAVTAISAITGLSFAQTNQQAVNATETNGGVNGEQTENFNVDELNTSERDVDEIPFNDGKRQAALPAPPSGQPSQRVDSVPPTISPSHLTSPINFPRKNISLEFYQARLANVFAALSTEGGINFVLPDAVGNRKVSFRLSALPYEQAVKAITQTEGLRMVEVAPRVIRIDTGTKLLAEAEVTQQEQWLNQLTQSVQIVRLNHARAKDVLPALQQLVKRADVSTKRDDGLPHSSVEEIKLAAHDRINAIIVEAPTNQAQKIIAIIERLDISTPQVEIATRIIELQKTAARFVGVNWDGGVNYDGGRGLGFGSLAFPNSLTAPFAVDTGAPSSSVGDFRFRIGSITDAIDLDLNLRLQESEGRAEILQSGKVIVQDGGTAKIAAGTTLFVRPVQLLGVSNDKGAGGLTEVKLQLILEVGGTPDESGKSRGITISKDGIVRIPVKLTSSIPQGHSDESVVAANSRELETEVVKKSGETAVIGGIYNTSTRRVTTGVPGLSKIPIIGALFRSSNDVQEQTELLILMTPRVIDPIENKDSVIERFNVSRSAETQEDEPGYPSDGLKEGYRKSRKHLGL